MRINPIENPEELLSFYPQRIMAAVSYVISQEDRFVWHFIKKNNKGETLLSFKKTCGDFDQNDTKLALVTALFSIYSVYGDTLDFDLSYENIRDTVFHAFDVLGGNGYILNEN